MRLQVARSAGLPVPGGPLPPGCLALAHLAMPSSMPAGARLSQWPCDRCFLPCSTHMKPVDTCGAQGVQDDVGAALGLVRALAKIM